MLKFNQIVLLVFLFFINEVYAETQGPVLEGPGIFTNSQILEFINKNPSAIVKNLHIKDKFEIPYEQKTTNLQFHNITFEKGLDISGNKGNLSIYNSVFKDTAEFYLSNFEDFHCESCIFDKDANFHSIEAKSFWLNKSVFNEHAIFVSVIVDGLFNLADVSFEKTVDFSGAVIGTLNPIRVRSNQPINILWEQFGDAWLADFYSWALVVEAEEQISRLRQIEMALQFWRKNFQQIGLKKDELIANRELITLRRKYFIGHMSVEWWASFLLGLPSSYGTSPFRPFVVGFFIIVIFGVIYRIKDPYFKNKDIVLEKRPKLLFSILYSLDTFIPFIDITGIKEWGWVIKGEYRWLEVFERILGLTISSLAAYSLGTHFFN